jgi:hypothetical protein
VQPWNCQSYLASLKAVCLSRLGNAAATAGGGEGGGRGGGGEVKGKGVELDSPRDAVAALVRVELKVRGGVGTLPIRDCI